MTGHLNAAASVTNARASNDHQAVDDLRLVQLDTHPKETEPNPTVPEYSECSRITDFRRHQRASCRRVYVAEPPKHQPTTRTAAASLTMLKRLARLARSIWHETKTDPLPMR